MQGGGGEQSMESPERDEVHVEQHGDGDVNVGQEPAAPEPEQADAAPEEQPEQGGDDAE
jgi:hypothetical protein